MTDSSSMTNALVLASLSMGEDSKSKKEVKAVLFVCLCECMYVSLGYSLLLMLVQGRD